MLSSEKLMRLIKGHSGSLMSFAEAGQIKYTTLYNATLDDEKLCRMNIRMFMKVAETLGMNVDDLVEAIRNDEQ